MLPLIVLLATGCDDLGRNAAKVFPVLEKVNEDYAEPSIDCDPAYPTPSPRSNGIVGTLTCGSVIEGNTSGGTKLWGEDFYQAAHCSVERDQWEQAPELIYRLNVPADLEAEVKLVSDCVDLDLVGVSWADDRIPKPEHGRSISQCDMDISRKGGKLRLNAVGKDWVYLVGVDGKGGVSGNFRLSVKCYTFR